ncbi:MAG: helix-turn-helix transcriptional regulator [Ruminococcaceae bacterium]|nr:helix-turn-helix transcriptional regulator [Oscillospiraceae bacterium]
MDFFQKEVVISKIEAIVFFPKEKGTPTQMRRTTHGLVFNLDCRSIYRFDTDEVLTCHAGDCIYLPQGSHYTVERYMERDTEERGIYAVNFLILSETIDNKPAVIRLRGKSEMQTLFSKAVHAWRKKDAGFMEGCFAALYQMIQLLKKEQAHYAPEKQTLSLLAPALDYIGTNYTKENIPVSHLAALCGISEPYLRKLFQNAFSVSPAVYMRNMRIEYAKELLASGEYSVTDVAMLSGFNDSAYFAREFKKAEGMSPKNYANKNII